MAELLIQFADSALDLFQFTLDVLSLSLKFSSLLFFGHRRTERSRPGYSQILVASVGSSPHSWASAPAAELAEGATEAA